MKLPFAALAPPLRRFWSSRSARGRLTLGLLALGIGCGAVHPAGAALKRLASALYHAGDSPAETRKRIFGASFTEGLETIRRMLPASAPYALAEAGDEEEGGIFWLRYELAPRKAIELGRLETLAAHPRQVGRLPQEVQWIVVSHGYRSAPELLSRRKLAELLRKGQDGG